ncbi:transcriptional regulator [Mycobacterium intermedium]|uniref:Transcriptional regulator n=1 Tax=Mycobacterium intermedium TaxID=28445 RepID=A0A1E3SDZ8_MYCIE|nr:helix-turn-helix transcriptional regulator [Mycobacterium intermedium]MCV6965972.1 helix-turn-helix transcriptional regulator [Mycobacterium intermedium]ODR00350.1 hypothetical protein BHQ20_13415 [Mycobacterium intermedium]OPE51056.1 transcriptional regulator [Mycobacterium intermedium]ORB01770.1 transcriptional regulator [Mycobacterium intermedium]
MWDLDDIERSAGLDPDSADYRLREALAQEDSELLEKLVQLRKDKGLTQQAVAERMHRDKAAVSNFERLSSDPHLSTIRRYAAAIGAIVTHGVADFEVLESSDYTMTATRQIASEFAQLIDTLGGEVGWDSPETAARSNVIPIRRSIRRRQAPRQSNPIPQSCYGC